jgi:hypothetical protein
MQAPPVPPQPQPAVAPAALPGGPQPPLVAQPVVHPQPTTYQAKYLDPAADSFGGSYINLYHDVAVGATQPATLRNAVYRDGNAGAFLHALVHIREYNADPDDPGLIIAYHRMTRHDTGLGRQPTPYDNLGTAFFGDIFGGQAPQSILVPDMMFNQTNVVQVPTAGRITQLIAADPAAELFGPFAAGDPDVEPVTTRQLIIVPNRYAAPFLITGMKPKQAYQALSTMISQDNQTIACEPLLDWLRVALTKRGGANPLPVTCTSPLAPPLFVSPQDQQLFAAYRLSVVHADFPHLGSGQAQTNAAAVAHGLAALTNEHRLSRQIQEQQIANKDNPKLPSDYFGVQLDKLMRWTQVASEADLPQIYHDIANAKKARVRVLIQHAVEQVLANFQYKRDFPVSITLANKIINLQWDTAVIDDLTTGLSVFSFGSLDKVSMEHQRRLNQHADTLYSGDAAPSWMDIATVQDSKQDLCIPTTLANLRYLVQRSLALWHVLLGPQHSVTRQYQQYHAIMVSREQDIDGIVPRDPTMKYMVPALLARALQIDTNSWLTDQLASVYPVQLTVLTDIFKDIDRMRPWEPLFPPGYIQHVSYGNNPTTPSVPSYSGTASTASSTLSGGTTTGGSSAAASTRLPTTSTTATPATTTRSTSSVVRNVHFNPIFNKFKEMNLRARPLKQRLVAQGIAFPTNSRNSGMCITYHAMGICNDQCKFLADHYKHTEAEDETLRAWCEQHYRPE